MHSCHAIATHFTDLDIAPTATVKMVNWTADKDQIVCVPSNSLDSMVRVLTIPQILRGIFKFHDIKSSSRLLDYLAKEIGDGEQTT